MKLQSFELDVIDFIPAIVLNILPLLFCMFLSISWRKNFLEIFMAFLIIFYEVMKLRSLELIRRYLKVSVVTPANEHMYAFFYKQLSC